MITITCFLPITFTVIVVANVITQAVQGAGRFVLNNLGWCWNSLICCCRMGYTQKYHQKARCNWICKRLKHVGHNARIQTMKKLFNTDSFFLSLTMDWTDNVYHQFPDSTQYGLKDVVMQVDFHLQPRVLISNYIKDSYFLIVSFIWCLQKYLLDRKLYILSVLGWLRCSICKFNSKKSLYHRLWCETLFIYFN